MYCINTMFCLIKVSRNTIELIVHTSSYCVLDLLCVKNVNCNFGLECGTGFRGGVKVEGGEKWCKSSF